MAENPTFQIPKDVIEPILEAQISSAVAAALFDKNAILNSIVTRVLTQRVNSEGKVDHYVRSDSPQFITWLVEEGIRNAVKAAIVSEVAKHQEVIRKAIADQLKNHKSPLVKQLVEGMTGALTNESTLKYRLNVTYENR